MVGPAQVPPPPAVFQTLCPLTMRLLVFNLAPGGVLQLVRQVQGPSGPPTTSVIGDWPISNTTQTIDLPPSFKATDPNGTVTVALTQSRCAGPSSPATIVTIATPGTMDTALKITQPAYACSRMISITGASPGSNLQAFYPGNVAASDPVCVIEPNFLLRLSFPLQAAQHEIMVKQTGCSTGSSPAVPILQVTQDLLQGLEVGPVLPEATKLNLSGLVPGARVYVSLNGELLPGGFDVYTATATVPILGGPPLNSDEIAVTQSLCQFTSKPTSVTVTTGTMVLTVQPGSVQFDAPASVTVKATDSDGNVLSGLPVFVGSTQIGSTGSAFAAPDTTGPGPVTFRVTDVVNGVNVYNPATISFSVTKAALTISTSPAQVTKGKTTNVTVIATETEGGRQVHGLSFTMGGITGSTGTAFAYSPAPNAANPTGTVHGNADYNDAPFSITLVNPVVPKWTLTIDVNNLEIEMPDPDGINSAVVQVAPLTYTATPSWSGGASHSGNLTASGVVLSWNAPSGSGDVTVKISGQASTSGDMTAGGTIGPSTVSFSSVPRSVGFGSHSSETISFLLGAEIDPGTGDLDMSAGNTVSP
jgi:hypothetical protein